LAEKMPYLTSLKLISDTGSVDFHHGESSVSTAELMSAFAGSEVNVRSFQNEICFGSRVPEADSYDRSFLLIGCKPKEDIAAIFERSVGAEPYSLQIFDSKQKEIFFTSLNDSGNVRPQNLSPEFVKISEQMREALILCGGQIKTK
ncbi:MAG: two-component sensor histidine kinase, partial [Parasutterella excrementihominis]